MSTVEKGDQLEEEFYNYLCEQLESDCLVYNTYSPELCKIYKKKKYYCREREADIEFDVVIEVFRQGADSPHLYVIFECKNYTGSVPESCVTDFSDKIGRIYPHRAKGILVVSSRLQSGAENIAKSRGLGIVKYDTHGWEVVAERKSGVRAENEFVSSQIFNDDNQVKSLRFSAYRDGKFFRSIDELLINCDPELRVEESFSNITSVPYVSGEKIQKSAQRLLVLIRYENGAVNLEKTCSELGINLTFTNQAIQHENGKQILGSANFDQKSIRINSHANKHRERFTIAHEIGHFYLKHDQYLLSETVLENDLFNDNEANNTFNFERLEVQANIFASDFLLPMNMFANKINEYRDSLNIVDRGHGFIFVDGQSCNYLPYAQLLSELSSYFDVSGQAVEIKLKRMGLLTDQRNW